MGMKFKTVKKIFDDYEKKFSNFNNNDFLQFSKTINEKKFNKGMEKAYKDIEKFSKNAETYIIKITLYQKIMKYHMPRSRGIGLYIPYMKEFHDIISDVTKGFREEFKILGLPAKAICRTFFKIPDNMSCSDKIKALIGFTKPITTPDVDNIIKFYNDLIKKNILFDDDLIYESISKKYYSLKPRIELDPSNH